jgi:hypothetical protein
MSSVLIGERRSDPFTAIVADSAQAPLACCGLEMCWIGKSVGLGYYRASVSILAPYLLLAWGVLIARVVISEALGPTEAASEI